MNLKAASRKDDADRDPLPPLQLEGSERFDELLMKRSRDRSFGKRDRTRALVLAHVARQLLADPANWPSVETVLSETGLSRGTFYNHFGDMNECVQALLSTFFQSLWKPRSFSVSSRQTPVDPVYEANLWYCAAYEVNAGLFAAFSQVAASTPSLLRMREEINAQWVARVVASSSRRRGRPYTRQQAHAFKGELRMLISMSIETLRERNVHRDAMLLASYPDVESLAKAITTMWHRTIRQYEGERATSGRAVT
jgi:AcrR family transcriptional regulator